MRRVALLLTLVLAGCLEREETIVVRPDGSVSMSISIRADSEDELYAGDAVPNIERGWLTELDVREEDGKEKFRLTAEQAFGPDVPLPASFASPTDAFREAVLQFPTTLTIEERRDGTYYHFRRMHPARPWAQTEGPRKEVMEQIDELVDSREIEELTDDERRQLLRLFARTEIIRYRWFARQAFRDVAADAPQDTWLKLNRELETLPEGFDIESIAAMLVEAQQDERVLEELREVHDNLVIAAGERMKLALTSSGWLSASRVTQFMNRYEYHRFSHTVSEDIADDQVKVIVRMPGEIVAHNADSVSAGEVRWEFGGGLLHDREMELMVTSVVRR